MNIPWERLRALGFFRFFFVLTAALLLGGCDRSRGGGLLAHRTPIEVRGVDRPDRLVDGVASLDGDEWKSHSSVVLHKGAQVTFDLGQEQPIRAGWLLADNDDTYEVSVSNDNRDYRVAWTAGRVGGAGLRPRSGEFSASGRYVRLRPSGGDGSYGVSEIQLFSEKPAEMPFQVARERGRPEDEPMRSAVLRLACALVAAVVLARRGASPLAWLLALVLPALAGYQAVNEIAAEWPLQGRNIALVRGAIAAVAALVVAWEAFAPKRLAPDRRVSLAVLGLCGVVGASAFYNLGRPQFYNDSTRAWTFAHYLDLRQYQPTARFFPEIGYRGIYDADVAAYMEDEHVGFERLERQPIRNLFTNHVETVGERRERILQMRRRFSDARWEEYKKDARYFRSVMGTPHYLETMLDLGGNATPVWISLAYLMWNALPTSDQSFLITGSLDLFLLLGMFFAIGRTFGLRAAFVVMVIFGTNDFIMFGTNWAGATLRHDWMVYLGLGACALASRRFVLGGALLGAAAAIRVFPALALFGATLPLAWSLAEKAIAERKFPSIRQALAADKPTVDIVTGAVGAIGALMLFSMIVLSPGAWQEWVQKVRVIDADSHVNNISLRVVIAGTEHFRDAVLRSRMPLFLAVAFGFIAAIVAAARGKRHHQAAMLALMLLPILLNPANYYLHLTCLLPMAVALPLVRKKRGQPGVVDASWADLTDARVWIFLLAMCASHYLAEMITDSVMHFYLLCVSVLACFAAMLHALLLRDGPPLVEALAAANAQGEAIDAKNAKKPVDQAEDEDDEDDEDDAPEQPPPSDKAKDDETKAKNDEKNGGEAKA